MSTNENNYYAVYVFNTNRHHSGSGNASDCMKTVKQVPTDVDAAESKTSDSEDSSVCLSLVETNLGAEQETVVRCYLLKSLSAKESLNFENEGKYVSLKFGDDLKQTFGCYYHLLSKTYGDSDSNQAVASDQPENYSFSKKHTFVVCLIGKTDGIMELFCSELGAFCCRILPLLDPQGIENKSDVQRKLENWYFYCVKYIERCLQSFKEDMVLLLQSALHGEVNIVCSDEDVRWDLERFVDACTLTNVLPTYAVNCESPNSALSDKELEDEVSSNLTINLQVTSDKLVSDASLAPSSYCLRWLNKFLSCSYSDAANLRNLLENFRLKAIRDLNTLRRLLKRAENDHYSLFRAYRFLVNSGYQDTLLHHVSQEATLTCSQDSVEIISFLSNFLKSKQQVE